MEAARVTIRGISYSLSAKWSEALFNRLWVANKKIMATPMKNREAEMQKDWDKLCKFLPKKQKRDDKD